MAYELRPYQKECKDILDKTPTGNHLVVMATGLGKTVVMTHLKRNGRWEHGTGCIHAERACLRSFCHDTGRSVTRLSS